MSAGDAIRAGRAFVEFFGEAKQLYGTMTSIGSDLKNWSSDVATQAGKTVSGGFEAASSAVKNLGSQVASIAPLKDTGASQQAESFEDASRAAKTAANSFHTASASASHFGAQTSASMTTAAASTNAVTASAHRVPTAFQAAGMAIRGIAGGIGFLVGNLGNIGRAAGLASWGLFGVSFAMKRLGYETTHIDAVKSSLYRISWAAFGANMAIKGMLLPIRLLSGSVGMITRLGGALASIPGRLGRLGSIASIGAMSTSMVPAAAPDAGTGEQGVDAGVEKKSGGFAASIMPILTGLAIAGPIGAAATALGVFIAGAMNNAGAAGGGGFFGQLMARGNAWAAWFGGMWKQVESRFKAVFGGMSAGGESFLTKLEKAFIPLTYAIENVWLPAFLSAITYAGSFFKSNTESMGQTWTGWLLDSVSALAEFVGNFDLYFQIAQQNIVLWASNAILSFGDFFHNVGAWLSWFGKNWYDVLITAGNYVGNVFGNVGSNLVEFFSKLWEWVKGGMTGDFNFDFKGLTEGFQSTITEWPKLIETELAESSPELEAIYAKLAERQKKAAAGGGLIKGVNKAAESTMDTTKAKSFDSSFGAASAQSQEAYSALSRLQNDSRSIDQEIANHTRQQVELLREANRNLSELIDKGGGATGLMGWSIA